MSGTQCSETGIQKVSVYTMNIVTNARKGDTLDNARQGLQTARGSENSPVAHLLVFRDEVYENVRRELISLSTSLIFC